MPVGLTFIPTTLTNEQRRLFNITTPPLGSSLTADLSPTVIIDGCNSDVANQLLDSNNSTIAELIGGIAESALSHGEFVQRVAHLLNKLKRNGVISGRQKGAIQSCAARSNIP